MPARLPADKIEEIAKSYRKKPSMKRVAKELGLSVGVVHKTLHELKRDADARAKEEGGKGVLVKLETLPEAEIRERSWDGPGALLLIKESVMIILQQELAKPYPEPLEFRAWSSALKDLAITYGVEIDKARLMNEMATQITAKADEIIRLTPEGLTRDEMLDLIESKVTGKVHPGLLPKNG